MCLPVKPFKLESEWEHAGLQCAVTQAREAGHRCGYVRVPPGHPAFQQDYSDVNVSVHGGLTFAKLEPCLEHADGQGWWFGFDCVHFNDIPYDPSVKIEDIQDESQRKVVEILRKLPKLEDEHPTLGYREHYWTHDEVVAETNALAEQLAGMSKKE